MSRYFFGRWGLDLAEGEFAKALAALALVGPIKKAWSPEDFRKKRERFDRKDQGFLPVSLANIASLTAGASAGPSKVRSARFCLELWDQVLASRSIWQGQGQPLLRLEVDPTLVSPARTRSTLSPLQRSSASRAAQRLPDLLWVLGQLSREDIGVDSAYVREDEPDRSVAWEWPLRVGLLPTARSRALLPALQSGQHASLFSVAMLGGAEDTCDLLLLPHDLRGGLARVLQHPTRLTADCVVVMGGSQVSSARTLDLIASVRREIRSAGVAVTDVDAEEYSDWFIGLIIQLSHNLPLDAALARTHRERPDRNKSAPPVLLASRNLMEAARVAVYAHRLGRHLKAAAQSGSSKKSAMPPRNLLTIAGEISRRSAEGKWTRETGDATVLVNMRCDAERTLGGAARVPRMMAAMAAPPALDVEPDRRRVSFLLDDVGAGVGRSAPTKSLAGDHLYDLTLWIGLPVEGAVTASAVFPSDKLPPSATGNHLQVAFCPLTKDSQGNRMEPQMAGIFLPARRDKNSTTCVFHFTTKNMAGCFKARIVVLCANRVIQTLMLFGPIDDSSDKAKITLEVESLVSPSFADMDFRRPFDAAIVVNHSEVGDFGFTTVAGGKASFREPVGIEKMIKEIQKEISAETASPDIPANWSDEAFLSRLRTLAYYGRGIWNTLPPDAKGLFANARRIQVVEARAGAYLPVEFFYEGALPQEKPELCPDARSAATGAEPTNPCPHQDEKTYVCPFRFWGLSKVIERQPPQTEHTGSDYFLAVPTSVESKLDVTRSALAARSEKVRDPDFTGASGIVEAIRSASGAVVTADNWDDWTSKVKQASPSLLFLFPHSTTMPEMPAMAAIEIGGKCLASVDVSPAYVAGPESKGPILLLLGCSTDLPDVPFLSFVREFKANQATLVIGTLSTISGHRTVPFVQELLGSLQSVQGDPKLTFGDAFLQAKRRLIARGDSIALTAVAYGDIEWRF